MNTQRAKREACPCRFDNREEERTVRQVFLKPLVSALAVLMVLMVLMLFMLTLVSRKLAQRRAMVAQA